MRTPVEVRNLKISFDTLFQKCRHNKVSRFSTDWGIESRKINLIIRKRIEEKIEEEWYGFLFAYWVQMSVILETYFKFPQNWRKVREKKTLKKELKQFRDTFLTGDLKSSRVPELKKVNELLDIMVKVDEQNKKDIQDKETQED